ncbi:unnamed protein product [Enterobius vermicularis]|uniref:G protein-activated inward rectifier potassium channel 3 n=1 Tax=Enterobius vermicularis TaxID=51028 RepID=A0A0N4V1J9_ENTVE|nr:unnamed protein product [Enterobius vermicularis]
MDVGECKPLVINDQTKDRGTRLLRTPKAGHHRFNRFRNRLVQKCGFCNISLVNVPKQRRKYFRDIFTTVIELKWRWSMFFFTLSFLLSWTFFYCIYYVIIATHGDFEQANNASWKPCVANGYTKGNVFLFSFTTQTTVGYGYRYPTTECPMLVVIMCIQFMVGVICQTLMAGVIFAKLARPIKRAATILFSKNAVICMRDGKLCLLFRVGDMRKSSLAEAHVRLQMIKKCLTYEGELIPFHQFDMDVGYDDGLDRVFVIWPITICHEIDEDSPLYEISKETLETAKFEIIAILEGVVETVGSTTQARTSYLPSEILWGKRFEKLVTYQRDNGEYRIDFGKFHNVYDVDTPTCSAKELDEMRLLTNNESVTGFENFPTLLKIMSKLNTDDSKRGKYIILSTSALSMISDHLLKAAGLNPERGYQFIPIADRQNDSITTSVKVKRDRQTQRLAVVSPEKSNIPNRIKIESDDEDEGQGTITVNVGLKHKKSLVHQPSPILGRKVSVRREPDLF